MTAIICTDIQRDNGIPLYTVKVYDIDTPANYHSYDCMFYRQGRNLAELTQAARERIAEELHTVDGTVVVSEPYLPSNLDEAAEEFYKEIECYPTSLPLYNKHVRNAFKAGAEWMAGQGYTKEGIARPDDCEIWINFTDTDIRDGDEVIVQIRKK